MKITNIQYYVEGENEQKHINVLKTQLKMIRPGKVQKLNVIDEKITDAMLRTLQRDATVVLIFDTDTKNIDILNYNIRKLSQYNSVRNIITIPQVPNLEGELIKSCDIKKITDLLNSDSISKFKSDFIRISNLDAKLLEHKFDISIFWTQKAKAPFQDILNQSSEIKILTKKG